MTVTRQRHVSLLMAEFSAITGLLIGALTWLYLKATNVGITLIWDKIGGHFPMAVYTLIVCTGGGVVIGLFRKRFGSYPEDMADAVRRVMRDRDYPYQELPLAMVGALLPLFFGGAIGPESGLVCLLLSLVFWARAEFGMARQNMEAVCDNDPDIKGTRLFRKMLWGMFSSPFRIAYDKGKISWTRKLQVLCGVACGLAALLVYALFCILFGTVFNMPHFDNPGVFAKDRLFLILLVVVGIAAGYLYLILRKVISRIFEKLEGRGLQVLNAVLGGLILGIIGGRLPSTMFSGGTDVQTIVSDGENLSAMFSGSLNFQAFRLNDFVSVPIMLILIGVIKLFLTNVCIESGWRGGHFFPLLFAGISIGYGFAEILGTNEILSIVVVTGALLGTILQQPIGALALSIIFFPIQQVGWMAVASFAAGCIPLPVTLRRNPANNGFIYNVIHQKERRQIPTK